MSDKSVYNPLHKSLLDDVVLNEVPDDDGQSCSREPGIEVMAAESTTVGSIEAPPVSASTSDSENSSQSSCRLQVLIGNLTWWTTDQQLYEEMAKMNVNDVLEIKFFEHRSKGQSKGYCVVTFGSEESRQKILSDFDKVEIEGRKPMVSLVTKNSLMHFEQSVTTRPRPAGPSMSMQQQHQQPNYQHQHNHYMRGGGDMHFGMNVPPPQRGGGLLDTSSFMPPPYGLHGPAGSMAYNWHCHMPPPSYEYGNMYMPHRPPPPSSSAFNVDYTSCPPPLPHFNPEFFRYQNIYNMRESRSRNEPLSGNVTSNGSGEHFGIGPIEFERLMNKNRTISTSSTTRAVRAATDGDFDSAIETLLRGISMIESSRLASDARCKMLVQSLRITLDIIENQRAKKLAEDREEAENENAERDRGRDNERSGSHRRDRERSHIRHERERSDGRNERERSDSRHERERSDSRHERERSDSRHERERSDNRHERERRSDREREHRSDRERHRNQRRSSQTEHRSSQDERHRHRDANDGGRDYARDRSPLRDANDSVRTARSRSRSPVDETAARNSYRSQFYEQQRRERFDFSHQSDSDSEHDNLESIENEENHRHRSR